MPENRQRYQGRSTSRAFIFTLIIEGGSVKSGSIKGISTFARQEWQNYTELNYEHAKDSCDAMIANGMIVNTSRHARPAVYQFNLQGDLIPGYPSKALMDRLKAMAGDEADHRDRRIGTFLLEQIEKGRSSFSTSDWEERFKVSKTMYGNDLRRAVNLGLIRKCSSGAGNPCVYALCMNPKAGVRDENLTETQKEYLTMLYNSFGNNEFSAEESAEILGQCGAASFFHLNNFIERGILTVSRTAGKANRYIFAVTSEDHPECFTQIKGPVASSKEEKQKSEATMAIAGTNNLTAIA